MGCYLTRPSIKLTGTHLNCTMYMIGWIEPLRVHVKCLALQELNTMSLAGSHFNIHLGDERYCESKMSCPRTQHKHSQPVLELALFFLSNKLRLLNPEASASTMRPLHGLKESLWLWHLHSHHGCFIGESLFTLFASLTCAYRYLMMLIKEKLWILKGHNSFSYLWKFDPNTQNGFGEILF